MVVVWSSNVQILYKKFALARDFYENIQSAWKSAHWKGIVKETMDTFWRSVKISVLIHLFKIGGQNSRGRNRVGCDGQIMI